MTAWARSMPCAFCGHIFPKRCGLFMRFLVGMTSLIGWLATFNWPHVSPNVAKFRSLFNSGMPWRNPLLILNLVHMGHDRSCPYPGGGYSSNGKSAADTPLG